MNIERVRKHLKNRNKRWNLGWSPADIESKLVIKEDRRGEIKKKSLGTVKLAMSIVPVTALAGSLLDHFVPDHILNEVPQLAEFAKEGSDAIEFDIEQGHGLLMIFIRDLIPTLRSFENGDYAEGITGLLTLSGTVYGLIQYFTG